ncbi:hypothetical protein J7L85_03295 [candidate division WOR-3 bacterium]|nr:hypothetical protein [candidate division WOR-3 bacterium]
MSLEECIMECETEYDACINECPEYDEECREQCEMEREACYEECYAEEEEAALTEQEEEDENLFWALTCILIPLGLIAFEALSNVFTISLASFSLHLYLPKIP